MGWTYLVVVAAVAGLAFEPVLAPAATPPVAPERFYDAPSADWHADALWKGIYVACDTNRTLSAVNPWNLSFDGPPISTSYKIHNDYRSAASFDLDFSDAKIDPKHVRIEPHRTTTIDFPLTYCPPYRLSDVRFGAGAK